MERDIRHIRHLLLFFFDQTKKCTDAYDLIKKTYPESVPTTRTCYYWFRQFKRGNFDLKLLNRKDKLKNANLQKLIDKNPYMTQTEMARKLNVALSTVSAHLKDMKQFQNQRNQVDLATQIRCTTCVTLLSRHNKEEHFLDQVVTGGEMSIKFGFTFTQTETNRSTENEITLCIWWDTKGVIYYELLRPHEIVIDRYSQQLNKLKEALDSKRPQVANYRRKVILLHAVFAQLNILKSVKKQILEFGWEVLPYPAKSFDIDPSERFLLSRLHLETVLKHTQFQTFEVVKKAIDGRIDSINNCQSILKDLGIPSLPELWKRCVDNKGKRVTEV